VRILPGNCFHFGRCGCTQREAISFSQLSQPALQTNKLSPHGRSLLLLIVAGRQLSSYVPYNVVISEYCILLLIFRERRSDHFSCFTDLSSTFDDARIYSPPPINRLVARRLYYRNTVRKVWRPSAFLKEATTPTPIIRNNFSLQSAEEAATNPFRQGTRPILMHTTHYAAEGLPLTSGRDFLDPLCCWFIIFIPLALYWCRGEFIVGCVCVSLRHRK
jgi:hypothetical protein